MANFSQIENELRGIAVQFTSIYAAQNQLNAVIDSFRQLELQLQMSRAAANGTVEQYGQMNTAARNFALASTYSAQQVAGAFYDLASAGLSVSQVLAASTGVVLLAQATMEDLQLASDLTASSLVQFNLVASDSYRVANLFVAATNSSLATLPKLSYALRQVGPVAASVNLSIEETVGMLDKLFDAGLRGEQAGTALRNAISRMIDPVGDGNKLLQNLGVTIFDTSGKMRNFTEILRDLSSKNLGLGDITTLVGQEGAAGFQTLLKTAGAADGATSALQKHIAEIKNTNAAYKQSVIQMNTLNGALEVSKNHFNELRIVAGEQLAPVIITVANSFSGFVDHLKEMDGALVTTYIQMAAAGAGGLILLKSMTGLMPALAGVGTSFMALRNASASAQIGFVALRNGIGGLGMRAAASSASALATGLFGMAGAAAGLLGVVAAIGAITYAVIKLQEAKENARLADLADDVSTRYDRAGNKPTGVSLGQLRDQTDYSIPFSNTVEQVGRLAQVDTTSGAGAANKYKMLISNVEEGQNLLRTLSAKIDSYSKDQGELRKKYEKSLDDLDAVLQINNDRGYVGGGAFSGEGGEATGLGPRIRQLFQSAEDRQRAINDTLANWEALASVPVEQRAAGINAFLNKQKQVIKDIPGISDAAYADIASDLDAVAGAMGKTDENTWAEFQENIRKEMMASRQRIKKLDLKGEDAGEELNTAIARAFEETKKSLLLSPDEIAKQVADLKTQQDSVRAAIASANKQISDNDVAVLAEMQTGVIAQTSANKEQQAKIADFIKSNPADTQAALDLVHQNAGDMTKAFESIMDALVRAKILNQDQVKKGMQRVLATPLIDAQQLQIDQKAAQIQVMQAKLALARTNGTATAGMAQELATAENSLSGEKLFDEMGKYITRGKPDVQADWQTRIAGNAANRAKVIDLITSDSANASAEFRKLVTDAGIRDITGPGIQGVAELFRTRYEAGVLKTQNDVAGVRKSVANRRTPSRLKLDDEDKTLKALLGLPTDEEMDAANARMKANATFAISNFIGAPLRMAESALAQSEIKQTQDTLAIQKKFKGFYTDHIAKGLSNVFSDPAMIDAFSGKDLQELMGGTDAKVKVGDKTFTNESVQTAEGIEAYLQAVGDAYEKAIGKAPGAKDRVIAARRMLSGMRAEVLATMNENIAETNILRQKQREAMAALEQFNREFDAQAYVDMLASQLEVLRNNPNATPEMFLDLNIKVGVGNVDIDTQSAIKKLQNDFASMIRQNGINVEVDGSDIKLATDQDPSVTQADRDAAQKRIDQYVKMREELVRVGEAKKEAFNPDSIEQSRQALDDYIDALQRANSRSGDRYGLSTYWDGLKAGAAKAAKDMPTAFEVGMDGAQRAVEGFASTAADAILGLSDDWKKSAASIIADIAKMIIQMEIMAAVQWALRAAGMFSGGGTTNAMSDASLATMNYAQGGVHFFANGGPMRARMASRGEVYGGGIKKARDASVAVFGEGDYPEAFIPMLDRKTVKVDMDGDGNAWIMVPSGQRIPVTMNSAKPTDNVSSRETYLATDTKAFAAGGIAGNAIRADRISPLAADSLSYGRSSGSGSLTASSPSYSSADTYHITVPVTIQGNAGKDEAEAIGEQVASQVRAMFAEREAEQQRKAFRQGGVNNFNPRGI